MGGYQKLQSGNEKTRSTWRSAGFGSLMAVK
jgi:hypothetical protein